MVSLQFFLEITHCMTQPQLYYVNKMAIHQDVSITAHLSYEKYKGNHYGEVYALKRKQETNLIELVAQRWHQIKWKQWR